MEKAESLSFSLSTLKKICSLCSEHKDSFYPCEATRDMELISSTMDVCLRPDNS